MLIEIEKVNNEVTTIPEGNKCIFFLICIEECVQGGERFLMMELQSQKETRTVLAFQIGRFIAFFNTSRSVDKPLEATSSRAIYLKRKPFKVKIG